MNSKHLSSQSVGAGGSRPAAPYNPVDPIPHAAPENDARQDKDLPPILIVGTGAMAGLFAARLAAAGHPITMLGAWQAGLQALRQHGVRLVEADGHEHSYPVQVASTPQECGAARYALVLVKAWQTERAARQLAGCLAPDGIAISLQNGLGNRETLAQALGAERVGSGISTSGATLLEPGRVRAGGSGILILGEHPRLGGLADWLQTAGFQTEVSADIEALLWGKLVVNAAINPLTALLGVPNGQLLTHRSTRRLAAAIASESAAVAGALDIQLPYPDPLAMVESVALRTAQNCSSMMQDITRQAPTEIDAICGAITQAGERAGVATPLNRALWEMVKRRAAGSFTLPVQARTLRQLLSLLPNPPAQKRPPARLQTAAPKRQEKPARKKPASPAALPRTR